MSATEKVAKRKKKAAGAFAKAGVSSASSPREHADAKQQSLPTPRSRAAQGSTQSADAAVVKSPKRVRREMRIPAEYLARMTKEGCTNGDFVHFLLSRYETRFDRAPSPYRKVVGPRDRWRPMVTPQAIGQLERLGAAHGTSGTAVLIAMIQRFFEEQDAEAQV